MRTNITVDFDLPGKPYKDIKNIASKCFQVALIVFQHLEEIKYEGTIEIIKITGSYDGYGYSDIERHLRIDFLVVFNPLLWSQFHEKFQAIANWSIGSKTISVYGVKKDKEQERVYIESLILSSESVNNLADTVVKAMKTIIRNRKSFYQEAVEKLYESDEAIIPLRKKGKLR